MKKLVREELRKARASLAPKRRAEAALSALNLFLPYHFVLSFASLPEEIDLSKLNASLAQQGRLLLPRIENGQLQAYHVDCLESLEKNAFGILEPNLTTCKAAEHIDVVLVPALGFDLQKHRIGYGKGFYDRFLALHPDIPSIGVGFKEQLTQTLPIENHDIALSDVHLF